jgi:hypothetical protein
MNRGASRDLHPCTSAPVQCLFLVDDLSRHITMNILRGNGFFATTAYVQLSRCYRRNASTNGRKRQSWLSPDGLYLPDKSGSTTTLSVETAGGIAAGVRCLPSYHRSNCIALFSCTCVKYVCLRLSIGCVSEICLDTVGPEVQFDPGLAVIFLLSSRHDEWMVDLTRSGLCAGLCC